MNDCKYDQLDVFSFIEKMFTMVKEDELNSNQGVSQKKKKPDSREQTEFERSFSKYLKKGEKIISLLKEKSKSNNRIFKKNNLIESINYKVYAQQDGLLYKWMYLFKSIKTRFIVPILNECIQNNESKNYDSFVNLFDIFNERIQVKELRETEYGARIIQAFFKKKLDMYTGAMELCIKGVGPESKDRFVYCPMSPNAKLTSSQSGRRWSYGSSVSSKVCANAYDYFGRFIIMCQFRKIVQDILNPLEIQELENNIVYDFLMHEQASIIQSKLLNGCLYIEGSAYDKEYICSYLCNYNYLIKIVKEDEKIFLSKDERLHLLSVKDFNSRFIMDANLKSSDWDFISAEIKYGSRREHDICANVDIELLVGLFEIIANEYLEDAREEKYRKDLESDYAKSYMTKKNIPQKHLEAMENSNFNDYFGYVEFDEDTDLLKVDELSKEFRTLAKYLNFSKDDEVSLRFRKLGNHKAEGLYYPYLKCLCVDVRAPHSMAHEYFHMLDYTKGKLSRSKKFQRVLHLYKKSLEDEVNELANNHEFKMQFNGKNKYNQAYYLQPTEVFARCGEMYLIRYLGINSSLVKIQNEIVYPDNSELKEAYIQYYNEVLQFKHSRMMSAM